MTTSLVLFKKQLLALGFSFEENKVLSSLCTWGVGGEADVFLPVVDEKQLGVVLRLAKEAEIPVTILGGGCNVLIVDEGVRGVVLAMKIGLWDEEEFENHFMLRLGAGVMTPRLSMWGKKHGVHDLELFSKIPGTLGGAIFGNAGAWGYAVSDYIVEVVAYDFEGNRHVFSQTQCGFVYRSSMFKQCSNFVIAEAVLSIPKQNKLSKEVVEEKARYRDSQQPIGRSAGSVFKNPEGGFAGKLIEEAGCKGLQIGQARVSDQHANFFLNLGGAKAADFLQLIREVKKRVKEKGGVELVEEVRFLGGGLFYEI
ncbi:MAG: UDP-N-acetylmuramate dehydrogenase [bacterium]